MQLTGAAQLLLSQRLNPLTSIAVAFETTPSNYNMLVYFFCTLFQFVCCIKCNAGGAPPAGRRPPVAAFASSNRAGITFESLNTSRSPRRKIEATSENIPCEIDRLLRT